MKDVLELTDTEVFAVVAPTPDQLAQAHISAQMLEDDRALQAISDRAIDELTAAIHVADAFKQPGLVLDALASTGGCDPLTIQQVTP